MKYTARLAYIFFWHLGLAIVLGLVTYYNALAHLTATIEFYLAFLAGLPPKLLFHLPVNYELALVCLICLLPYLLLQGFRLKTASTLLFTITIIFVTATYLLALFFHLALPLLYMLFSLAAGTIVAITLKMIFATNEQEFLRTAFSQFVSPDMLKELLKDPHKLRLQGREYPITVMFVDIRGFTSFSERNTPVVVVKRLNELLNIVTSVIVKHHGTIDKYMGDSVMAFWGAPITDKRQTTNACLAALEIKRKIESETEFKIGIGICHGPAIVGNIGSSRRFDFTAIGDTVNIAARLETATKEVGRPIIISESVITRLAVEKLAVSTIDLGQIAIRGKNDHLHIYALV